MPHACNNATKSYLHYMKTIALIATIMSTIAVSQAQTVTDSVTNTVKNLFLGMKNADGKLLASCFADDAILQTVTKNKEGIAGVKNEPANEFIAFIAGAKPGDADERITIETLKIDADLAIVWTPYQFYYKGVFSHCGVNSFQLVRYPGGWKIQYLIDTRRKDHCN